jgi:hypothetical protein
MARKTIEQRIALDGGKEILDQLKQLGADGEKAFNQIVDASKRANGPASELGRSVETLRRNFRELGDAGKRLGNDLKALGNATRNFGSSVATVGKRLAGIVAGVAAATVATVAFAKAGAEAADVASKQAQALGLPIDAYGRLQFAAEQAGVSQEQFGTAITRLNQELGRVAEGNDAAAQRFAALGVSVQNAQGDIRATEEILGDLAEAFAAMPDGAEKSAMAVQLFGRSGAQLLPLLNEGRAGIAALGAEAERLGITFTEEQARIGVAMNDALNRLSRARQAVTNQLGLLFAPTITRAADALTDTIASNRQAIQELAEDGLARALPLVEDFINALLGRDADVANTWILDARDAMIQFGREVRYTAENIIIPAYELIIAAAQRVAEAVNSIFGTEFTGQQVLIATAFAKLIGLFGVLTAGISLVVAAGKALVSTFLLIGPLISTVSSFFGVIATGAKFAATALAAIIGWPATIALGVAAAAAAIYTFWDEIVDAARGAVALIGGAFRGLSALFRGAFAGVARIAEMAFNAIVTFALTMGDRLIDVIVAIVPRIGAAFDGIRALVGRVWDGIVDAAALAWGGIRDIAVRLGNFIIDVWQRVSDGATRMWNGVINAAREAWSRIRQILSDGLGSAFRALGEGAVAIWTAFRDAASRAITWAEGRIRSLISLVERAARAIRSAFSSSGGSANPHAGPAMPPPTFATGGRVRGPGTGTSDSILARLSNGEFVIRAAAVRHYGPELIAAINAMRLKLPKFSGGGMAQLSSVRVPSPADVFGGIIRGFSMDGFAVQPQRFADGGLATASSQGRPVNVTIGGESFAMTATDDVADRLTRHATRRQLSSLGRKPGWYGR